MKKSLLLISFFLILIQMVAAQEPVQICATMEEDAINRAKFPQRGTLQDFEDALGRKIHEISLRSNGRTQATVITFPVVVHVVHNGEPVGSGTNLSKEQIQAQLEVLNEDFRRKAGTPGFNNSPVGADIEIEFCLSPIDPAGIPLAEPGIHRYRGGQATWTRQQIEGSLKPTTIWNPNYYYNIWTLNFGGTDVNLLGYAQFPDKSGLAGLNTTGGPATTDGVVIKYSSFGSVDKGTFPVMQAPYNRGRTLSHETGHWLGLRHIWGDASCGNDFVDDTPTSRAENRGCPANKIGCDGSSFEMVQNYMDYTDDACMNIFTQGQKARIIAVTELSPRRKVANQSNLCGNLVESPPVADFTVDQEKVLLGGEAIFTDLSTNFPTQWTWSFQGGDPSVSTVQNPRVRYSTPGDYNVSLTVTNIIGNSQPLTKTAYIHVSEEGLCSALSNFDEAFTPTLIKLSDFGSYTGYLTGQNSAGSKAISEHFTNPQGYKYISGVDIQFGKILSAAEDAIVTVVVWNARGLQSGPGSVIERKEVLAKQIKADVEAGRPTAITFDRETPVFSRPFHVGVELTYAAGDTLAVISSANGEATSATSWVQNSAGIWSPYSIAYGANMAMNIVAKVGMNLSVQVSASKLYVNPGEEVILNAKGATIFVWNSDDNQVQNIPGPQLIARPVQTTTYQTEGLDLELCNDKAFTTIYVKSGTITAVDERPAADLRLFPNPGGEVMNIFFESAYTGEVEILVYSPLGQVADAQKVFKNHSTLSHNINTSNYSAGLYIVQVKAGSKRLVSKWIKR